LPRVFYQILKKLIVSEVDSEIESREGVLDKSWQRGRRNNIKRKVLLLITGRQIFERSDQ
jgi:hypothetical protein